MIRKIKGFVHNTLFEFRDRYYRCACGSLLADEDFENDIHAGHKAMYATYVTFTEFVKIRLREFWRYRCQK